MVKVHFYAPTKNFGNKKIEAFTFNVLVIWLMTAFLYVTLIFDGFGKILSFISRKKMDE